MGSPENVEGALLSYNSTTLAEQGREVVLERVECRRYKVQGVEEDKVFAVRSQKGSEISNAKMETKSSRANPLPVPLPPLIHCTPRGSIEKQGRAVSETAERYSVAAAVAKGAGRAQTAITEQLKQCE